MIAITDDSRPTPFPRDRNRSVGGRHRPENVGTAFLAASLVGDPEHYQRVARQAQAHAAVTA